MTKTKRYKKLALERDNLLNKIHQREIGSISKSFDKKIKKRVDAKIKTQKEKERRRLAKEKEKLKAEEKRKKEWIKKQKVLKESPRKIVKEDKEVLKKEMVIAKDIEKEFDNQNVKIEERPKPQVMQENIVAGAEKQVPVKEENVNVLKQEKQTPVKEVVNVQVAKEPTQTQVAEVKTPKEDKIGDKELQEIMKQEFAIAKKISVEFDKDYVKEDYSGQGINDAKLKKSLEAYQKELALLKQEISKIVVGHDEVINGIVRGFLADGHVLIEGVPGIAKTLLIRTIAKASGCDFSRVQFTVDLLPTDITGVTTYDEGAKTFKTIKGPIFSNFIIADEINRAPPKVQSAMLEAMQEKQVTIGKETHKLPVPFFVMANNNPLESSGTYPLPEAQVDRFLFKLLMGYTSNENEEKVIDTNITTKKFEDFDIKSIISPDKILKMQADTKKVLASPKIKKYIVRIVDATRKPKQYGLEYGKYIEWGCSPRASIGLTIAAKADALMHGLPYITPQNVKNVAKDVLRHRLILNYMGQAENVSRDKIVEEILNKVPLP